MSELKQSVASLKAETIEYELSLLWAKLGPGVKTIHTTSKQRVVNLIIAVSDDKAAEKVSAELTGYSTLRPGRYIIVVLNTNSSCCEIAIGMSPQSYYERIIVPNEAGKLEELLSCVNGLIKHELPVILWWRYIFDPKENLFEELSHISRHIIIDSITLTNPVGGFAKILEFGKAEGSIIHDINWDRLDPWRFALSGLYDIAAYRSHLKYITRLDIEYCHQVSRHNFINNSQALMLFGWIASRLDWRPLSGVKDEQNEYVCHIATAEGNQTVICKFHMSPAACHLDAGIKAVQLTSEFNGVSKFDITRLEDCQHMQTKISLAGEKAVEKITCLETGDEISLIAKRMNTSAPDIVYNQTLAFLRRTDCFWKQAPLTEI